MCCNIHLFQRLNRPKSTRCVGKQQIFYEIRDLMNNFRMESDEFRRLFVCQITATVVMMNDEIDCTSVSIKMADNR